MNRAAHYKDWFLE